MKRTTLLPLSVAAGRARVVSLATLLVAGACAGGPGTGGGSAPTLSFAPAAGGALAYLQGDTAVITVDVGGQTMDVTAVSRAVLDVQFEPAPAGVRVSATFRELDASLTNPVAPPQRMTAADVEGPLVFDLDSRGRATVVSTPEVSSAAASLLGPTEMAHSFFPRLPDARPAPGMAWTDTIAYQAEEGPGSVVARTVMTYTVVGDTVVAGRSLLRVDLAGNVTRTLEGATAGMSVLQDMTGTVRGHFLWDVARGVLHSQEAHSELTGVMDVDAAPYPMDMTVRTVSRTGLAGG
ncbi:MAG: hypothetical protein RQ751_13725 [Longimicrobiales bacterium]|nr:hypothetical protein [Longimicrobiales bacterium]